MICLPPVEYSEGSWIGFAYVNHYISAYNDEWCHYVSTAMHEIGHNLELAHSKEHWDEYGDHSCLVCSLFLRSISSSTEV